MNVYHIKIAQPAENDLQGVAHYIAKELREPLTAQRVIAKIGEAIMDLEQMPYRNALVNDERLAFQGIRKLMIDSYIAFYVISEEDERVTIIRILLGKRGWNNLL